jgi:hypothetical protein
VGPPYFTPFQSYPPLILHTQTRWGGINVFVGGDAEGGKLEERGASLLHFERSEEIGGEMAQGFRLVCLSLRYLYTLSNETLS